LLAKLPDNRRNYNHIDVIDIGGYDLALNPKLRSAIESMYVDLKVILQIGKVEESMSQAVGVRQGYFIAPVLCLFMVMTFAELLEKEWNKVGLEKIKMRQHYHSPRDVEQLTSQKRTEISQGSLSSLFCITYMDDGTFTFERREQMEIGLNLIFSHFTMFGLEINIGRGPKASKTECIFFPPPGFLRCSTITFNKRATNKRFR